MNTAKESSNSEKPKLDGYVTKILNKSKYSTADLLREVKDISQVTVNKENKQRE